MRVALSVAAVISVAACGLSGPPRTTYVLGAVPPAASGTLPLTGLPIVEVRRVQIPDYLDSTDILERLGDKLIPSPTGLWGERLSVGVTRALTAALAARLPAMVVTATRPLTPPTRQVLVDISAFEPRADHRVVLVAHWSIVDGASRRVLIAEQTSLVEAVAGSGDDATVAAMSHAVDDLAGAVAAGIGRARRLAGGA